jgi:hypothetical protein
VADVLEQGETMTEITLLGRLPQRATIQSDLGNY